MVNTIKQIVPDAYVSALKIVTGRPLKISELVALATNGIEVSAPELEYVGAMLEAEYTYYFQAVHSCV